MTSETLSHETAINKCGELALVDQQIDGKGNVHATIDPYSSRANVTSTATMHSVSEPHLAIVVQGKNKCC